MGPLLRTAGDGADTAIWLAADPAAAGDTGRLFLDRRARPFDRAPTDPADRGGPPRLWDLVVRLARRRRSCTRPGASARARTHDHSQHWSLPMTRIPRTHRDRPADRRGLRLHRRLRPRRRMGPEYNRCAAARHRAARAGRPVCARGADGTDRADGVSDHRVRPPSPGGPRRRGIGRATVDDIRFEQIGDRTVVDYMADIRLGGLLRLAQPFLGAVRRIGQQAAEA